MMTDLRKQMQGPMYKPFLLLIAFSLLGASLPAIIKTILTPIEQWSLRINGYDVSTKELAREVQQKEEFIAQIRSYYGAYSDYFLYRMGMSNDPRQMAVESLIKEIILYQAGRKLGIDVSDEYAADMLNKKEFVMQELYSIIPGYALDANKQLNKSRLVSYLSSKKIPMDSFDKKIERLLTQYMVKGVVGGAYYLPQAELEEARVIGQAPRQYSVVKVSLDDVAEQEKDRNMSDDQLQAFFDKNSKQYTVPEKREGVMWEFNVDAYKTPLTHEEINTYYNDNKEQFVASPMEVQVRYILIKGKTPQAQQAIVKIKGDVSVDPQAFARIAQEESQDQETAANGGLMPFFSKGQQNAAVERAAFMLKNDGDVSDIIETEDGYALVQRVAKKPKAYKRFEEVTDVITQKIQQERFKKAFAQDMSAIFDSGESIEQGLMALAEQKGVLSKPIALQELGNSKMSKTLFKLKKGRMTSFFEQENGFVIKLTQVQEQFLPTLESIKSVVKNDFVAAQALKSLESMLVDMRMDAKTLSLQEIAQRYDATFDKTAMISPVDTALLKALEKDGMPVKEMLGLSRVGAVLVHQADQFGYLVRLDAIEDRDNESSKAAITDIVKKVDQDRKQRFIGGFVASLFRNATIKSNDYSAMTNEDYSL